MKTSPLRLPLLLTSGQWQVVSTRPTTSSAKRPDEPKPQRSKCYGSASRQFFQPQRQPCLILVVQHAHHHQRVIAVRIVAHAHALAQAPFFNKAPGVERQRANVELVNTMLDAAIDKVTATTAAACRS